MSNKKRKWNREQLLYILKEYYEKHGKAYQLDFCNKNGLPHYQTYIKEFGSWNNAKRMVGISNEEIEKRNRYTKEDVIYLFKKLVDKLGYISKFSELESIDDFPSTGTIYKYFNSYDALIECCGLNNNTIANGKYKEEFLISEIHRFVKEFNRIPTSRDFENLPGYPTRKTFTNHFGNFNNAIKLAGFEPTKLSQKEFEDKYKNKEYLSSIIFDYIHKYNKIPTLRELIKEHNHSLKWLYKQVYGSWNNALKELNLPLNAVSSYDDEFLEQEFHRFVKEHGRVPTYAEFNNSEYPSFWCYQNRFGSWNNAVIAYGYEINDSNRKYILDDGEICASSYEFDISTWLKSKNIQYKRNIKYADFIDNYKGKMDCDYVIIYNNEIWYVEMAGFLSDTDFNKYSEAEKNYFFKLKYKRKLLRRQGVNYIIIEPCDLKKKSLEEIFFFIK